MHKKVINLLMKRKIKKIKKNPEFQLLNLNLEKIFNDIDFFKKNSKIIQKSENLLFLKEKNIQNYAKIITNQRNFIAQNLKLG